MYLHSKVRCLRCKEKTFCDKKVGAFFTMLSFYYFCNIFPARSLFTQKKLAKKTFAEKVLPLGAMEKRLCL